MPRKLTVCVTTGAQLLFSPACKRGRLRSSQREDHASQTNSLRYDWSAAVSVANLQARTLALQSTRRGMPRKLTVCVTTGAQPSPLSNLQARTLALQSMKPLLTRGLLTLFFKALSSWLDQSAALADNIDGGYAKPITGAAVQALTKQAEMRCFMRFRVLGAL